MIDTQRLSELEKAATGKIWAKHDDADVSIYCPEFECWIPESAKDADLIVFLRNHAKEIIEELDQLRNDCEVIKEMKGGHLQCTCHPEGTNWKECSYMTGAYRAFEAAARVVTKEKINETHTVHS